MRPFVLLAALTVSSNALAGGIGIVTTGGLHGERVYFYDRSNSFAQYKQTQTILSGGFGLDLMIGDRDDRITGNFRTFYLIDGAQRDPAETSSLVAPENVVANVRDEAHPVGVAQVGVNFGVLGDPDRAQMLIAANLGSGFLTKDHREFLLADVGVGGTWNFAPTMQAFGTVGYAVRQHKDFQHGANIYLGARYLFD
jgi:hypothetical protein